MILRKCLRPEAVWRVGLGVVVVAIGLRAGEGKHGLTIGGIGLDAVVSEEHGLAGINR